jgi:hypothetical protein
MTLIVLIIVALAGILFLFTAMRRLRQRKIVSGLFHGATALVLVLLVVAAALILANLSTYRRLSYEQPAGELQLTRTGERQFDALLSYPNGTRANYALRGDEWQVDARVLKWHAFANLIGGRYSRAEDEVAQPRTAYGLNPPQLVDPWDLAHRYRSWIPWVDAVYGSATFLPMADGALYEIKVSQSGLLARPLNQAARDAVGGWH